MKKILSFLTLPLFYLISTAPALAQSPIATCPTGQFQTLCDSTADPSKIVGTVITLLLIGAVIIALVFLIYGGIRWIMSGGDKAAVESARNTIVGAVIGLAVVFASFVLLQFVGKVFGISNILSPQLPTF